MQLAQQSPSADEPTSGTYAIDSSGPSETDSLGLLVQDCGPLSRQEAVAWALWIIGRVERLHNIGKCHGSVSPYAVLTDTVSPDGQAALEAAGDGSSLVAFQSPERLVLGIASQIDDLWALGVSLYFLLTGYLPFPGKTPHEVRHATEGGGPTALLTHGVVDKQLQRLVNCLLNVSLADRVVSLRVLRTALQRWQQRTPTAAPPGATVPPPAVPPPVVEDDLDDDDVQTLEMLVPKSDIVEILAARKRAEAARTDATPSVDSLRQLDKPTAAIFPESTPIEAPQKAEVETDDDYEELSAADFLAVNGAQPDPNSDEQPAVEGGDDFVSVDVPLDLPPDDSAPGLDAEEDLASVDVPLDEESYSEPVDAAPTSEPVFDIGAALEALLVKAPELDEPSMPSEVTEQLPLVANPYLVGLPVAERPEKPSPNLPLDMSSVRPSSSSEPGGRQTVVAAAPQPSVSWNVVPVIVAVLSAAAIVGVWAL